MREKLEEIVGFKYEGDLQVKAMHDVVLDQVGLDKLKAAVKRPLSGLRVVSYYGCALVRDPKVVQMGDYENPLFLDDSVTALGGQMPSYVARRSCRCTSFPSMRSSFT